MAPASRASSCGSVAGVGAGCCARRGAGCGRAVAFGAREGTAPVTVRPGADGMPRRGVVEKYGPVIRGRITIPVPIVTGTGT